MPLKNHVQNGSFEQDFKFWKPNDKLCGIVPEDAFKGGKCAAITGDENAKPYIFQSITLPLAVPAGEPVYIGFASKVEDCNIDAKPPNLRCRVTYTNGDGAYVPVPILPVDPHEWLYTARTIIAKNPIKNLQLYLCYYNQTGKSFWDDVVVKSGNVNLSFKIAAENIKQVKVFNSLEGMIFQSEVFAAGKNSFEKTMKVPGFGAYYVQVEEQSGKISGQRYPADEDAPARATANSLPVLKRFNSEVFEPQEQNSYSVELPDISGKEVILAMTARLDATQIVAGFTPALLIKVNNVKLDTKNLVDRKAKFTIASGSVYNIMGAGLFIVYYAPWIYTLNEDNKYCQVDVPDKNPFVYKFNITGLVKSGQNEIIIGNMNHNKSRKVKMYLSNCRVIITDKK